MSIQPSRPPRRTVLKTAAAASAVAPAALAAAPQPSPGRPGDFDFLSGEWRIRHRRFLADSKTWDEFEGEATCRSILGGVCSVEELRIPARNFSGMGLRLLDVERAIWVDHWVNAKGGVLTPPGVEGRFVNGDGVFISDETDGATPIKVRGLWDGITATSCRWSQAVSRDGGATWEDNWLMEWRRVGA
ncbi:hypothetical protein [Caulobacter mirabilis]|uniref:DUF1579 domain-containing protein n=1 Tax=Caulobacter mirabilis TaxID=69666 RepID=A0A2D2AW35_9CAUL|nr:hypothetical protein [Caulobacter mirabilis]ATQ42167.1 hypothetical protein CSW64_06930 [Caulobacter mirabilis]